MQRVNGFLLLLCIFNCGFSHSESLDTNHELVNKQIVIQADDLFSSLKMLSEQTNNAIFFAAGLENIFAPFSYSGHDHLSAVMQLVAAHYHVDIEFLEGALMVSAPPKTINIDNSKHLSNVSAEKDSPLEEVMISASSIQSKRARRNQITNDALPNNAVRVESLSLLNAASFATNNLADSLLNVAGVSASYDSGEAHQVAMRGLSGDFIHVAINGMQTLALHGSSLDSREQNERALAFDFNVLPSELFEQIDIVKEYNVAQDSGGIAGNINLYTSDASQLMEHAYRLNGMFEFSHSDRVDEPTRRAAFSWQYKQQRWFYMLGASINNKVTQEQGYNTYRWRQLYIGDTDISQLSDEIKQKLNTQQIYFPRGNRYSVWNNTIGQQGATGALHYYGRKFSSKFDWLYAQLNNQKQEYHLATRGIGGSALASQNETPSILTRLELDEYDYLQYGQFENAQIASESRQLNKKTQFTQLTWRGTYQLSPKFKINWLVGAAKNKLTVPNDEKVFLKSFTDLTTNYSSNRTYPQNTYSMDLNASQQWQLDEINIQANQSIIKQTQSNINVSYQQGKNLWQGGIQYKSFVDEQLQQQQKAIYKREFNSGFLNNTLDDEIVEVVDYHKKSSWLGVNNNAIAKRYLADISLHNSDTLRSQSYRLKRINTAVWLQYGYQQQDYSLDLGVRMEHFKEQINQLMSSRAIKINYSRPLVSANFRYVINSSWQTRLNISENLTPVPTKYVNPAVLELPNMTDKQTSVESLSAYKSQQVAMQLIGELNSQTDLVGSVYIKKLSGLINYQQSANDEDLYLRVNQASAWVKGVDLDITYHLNPATSISAAYSYADSQREYRFAQTFKHTEQLEGLSKHVARISLDYQRETWGTGLQLNYRSDYISEINYQQVWADQFETGFLPYKRINWLAYYAVNDALELNVGVNNLSNEYYREYAGQHHAIYNTTEAGRQYYLRFILMW